MTQEDKNILLKEDLCARLPYGVKINIRSDYTLTMEDMELNAYHLAAISYNVEYRGLRPYLRPMSSMTKEERLVYEQRLHDVGRSIDVIDADDVVSHIDWLLSHHFDFRGLFHMGLALEAPEGMYKTS